MRRLFDLVAVCVFAGAFALGGMALADGPSGSYQCHLNDDDCDRAFDEDPVGDANGDLNNDDDGDGLVDEDPPGDAFDDPGENQQDCNETTSTKVGDLGYVYAGSNGAEVCGDDTTTMPVDGNATVSIEGQYIAIDGDNTNSAPANGFARVDENGVHCGDDTNQDSSADQTNNTQEDCG
jgi:uncharacterized Zn-binding protein involved in type VI secretion